MDPRGIRNNNPLNIRISNNKWKHKVIPSKDKDFEQFETMEWGIRAAFVIMRTYINKYSLDTPAKIITRWAPESENDTKAYINTVYKKTGYKPYEKIDFNDKFYMIRLLQAMIWVECGGYYLPLPAIERAYDMI